MAMIEEERRIVRFGLFEADLRAGELRRNGSKVRLQEQPFQVLTALLDQPGEVVTRDALRNRLWPSDTFVDFDHSLNTAVRRLRDALGDTAENPRYVETVARRGYRFLAPLKQDAEAGQPAVARHTVRRKPWSLIFAVGVFTILAAGVAAWQLTHRPAPASTFRRLTAKPEEDPILSAIISPDGKYLAFADQTGFYLQQVDTGETHTVPLPKVPILRDASWSPLENPRILNVGSHSTGAALMSAIGSTLMPEPHAWFPDSTHLIATWITDAEAPPSLWEISVMGGEPRKLADEGWRPSISPNGEQIAFLRNSRKGDNEIWMMQGDGSQPHLVRSADGSFCGTPVWSPDSHTIAFARSIYVPGTAASNTEIDALDLATRKSQALLARPGIGPSLAWLQDGRMVFPLYEAPPNQMDSNLWWIRVDAHALRVTGSPTRITSQAGAIADITVSSDATRLALVRRLIQPDVYVADVRERGGALGPLKRLTLDERADVPYSWTPDSRSVIFVSDRYGNSNIFKQDVDAPTPDLLVGGKEELSIPRLSPDATQVIYLIQPKVGAATSPVRMMRVPLSGGASQMILEGPGIMNQQCARLPSTLCLYSEMISHNEMRLYTFDPVNGKGQEIEKARVVDEDAYAYNWSLSPDGSMLAMSRKFATHESAVRLLSLVDGSERTIPIPGWPGIASFDWASDGKSIWVVASTSTEAKTLLNVDLQGRIRPVLEEEKMMLGWAIPSPDGRKVALWKASGGSNVWMVENF
jgi:Tol biopolymer transport system component/DNA-binding winged helix-turn-helix (wHTH) protein